MSEKPIKIIRNDSGAQSLIGYEVHIFEDRVEAILPVRDQHRNRLGYLHGGLTALLLDSTCGYAASRALRVNGPSPVVTLNLQTSFLAPGKGAEMRAVSRVTRAGRSIVFADGEVYDESGVLLATGTGTFKAVKV